MIYRQLHTIVHLEAHTAEKNEQPPHRTDQKIPHTLTFDPNYTTSIHFSLNEWWHLNVMFSTIWAKLPHTSWRLLSLPEGLEPSVFLVHTLTQRCMPHGTVVCFGAW